MFRFIVLSSVLLYRVCSLSSTSSPTTLSNTTAPSKSCNSTFNLLISEDSRSFKKRNVIIFHPANMKQVAEEIECQLGGTVKEVDFITSDEESIGEICESDDYLRSVNMTKPMTYFVTITNSAKYVDVECGAVNQLNLMKLQTPRGAQWAVHVKGLNSDVLFPLESDHGVLKTDSVEFALNAMFFASALAAGEDTFKSLEEGKTPAKKHLVQTTFLIYIAMLFIGIAAICALVVLIFLKRQAAEKKRESEKSKLLKNQANNAEGDETPVEFVDDGLDKK